VALVLALAAAALAGCTAKTPPSGAGAGASSYRPHASQSQLPSSNGFAAAVFDASPAARRVVAFRDHIYDHKSPTEPSKNFGHGLFFGYRRAGLSQWLTDLPLEETGYVPGTGIVRTLEHAGGIAYECFYFAPLASCTETALVAIVHATNEGPQDVTDCALFADLDFHLGGDADAAGEWVWNYAPGSFMEGKDQTGNRIAYRALGPLAHWCAGNTPANDPLAIVNAGGHLTDQNDGQTPAADVKVGFESPVATSGGAFAAGSEAWFGVALVLREDGDEPGIQADLDALVGPSDAPALLAREKAFWDAWHAGEILPPGATPDEIAVMRQSGAVLKMAQCREGGAGAGQILASLPPGQWNIAWVRDACYAIRALVATGHMAEARAGLAFFLNASAGALQSYVGAPYAISVARYTGGGVEESDDDGQGPNVELDDFGEFLGALRAYVEASGDTALLLAAWPTVRDQVADVLVSVIDANGLVRADSSIWERHQTTKTDTPDGAKHFAYTSITAVDGLEAASALAAIAGDAAKAQDYAAAAARVLAAIEGRLVLAGAICSSLEDAPQGIALALDGSVVEAVNWGLESPTATSQIATATMAALDGLRTFSLLSPGYLRNTSAKTYGPDNWYDRQEWVFIDLRAVSALARVGRKADAGTVLDWVTAQTRANFDLVAELYDEGSADYRGAVPMAGFGAGAFILAVFDYETS
jgi:GH15 family glucan-1,4-alpha-glucosidase